MSTSKLTENQINAIEEAFMVSLQKLSPYEFIAMAAEGLVSINELRSAQPHSASLTKEQRDAKRLAYWTATAEEESRIRLAGDPLGKFARNAAE